MVKKSCVNCHFFVKNLRDNNRELTFDVSANERDLCRKNNFSWQKEESLACHLSVWDEGYRLNQSKYDLIVQQNRSNYCFFWKYRPGMLQPAAETLQKREMEIREASKDRRLTIIGLWIAALALLISVVLQILEVLHWWPFWK